METSHFELGNRTQERLGCLLVPHDPVTWDACKNYKVTEQGKKSVNHSREACAFLHELQDLRGVVKEKQKLAMQSQSVNCFFLLFSLLSYSSASFYILHASPVVLLKFLSCKW